MPEGDFLSILPRIFVAITLVFGLLFLLRYWLLRGVTPGSRQRLTLMRVREQIYLSPRCRILLLDVADRNYLVVLNDSSVAMTEIKDVPVSPLIDPVEPVPTHFAAQLHEIIARLGQGGKR